MARGRMWHNPWGEQELLPHHLYKEGWRSVPKWWNWEAWWYDLGQVRHLRDQLGRVLGCVYLQGLIWWACVTHQLCYKDFLLHLWRITPLLWFLCLSIPHRHAPGIKKAPEPGLTSSLFPPLVSPPQLLQLPLTTTTAGASHSHS